MIKMPVAPGDRKVAWLNQCKSDWKFKPIKYLCSINSKVLSENANPDYEIMYIDISSVNSNGRWAASAPMAFVDAPSRARRVVVNGDVIISTVRTYLRAIAFVEEAEEDLICSTGFAVLSAGESVNPRFLAYWVRSTFFVDEIVARSVGVSYPATNASHIGNLPFPTIDYGDQHAIASFLGCQTKHIDTLISKKERQIELLQERRAALISNVVTKGLDPSVKMKNSGVEWLGEIPSGWAINKLKFLTNKIGSGITPKGGSEVYIDSGIPLLRSQNIHFDGLRLNDVARIPKSIHDLMGGSKVKPKDVLLNITGASIGRCSIVPENFEEANVNQHVCIVRPNKKILSNFIHYFFSSSIGQLQVFYSQMGTSREGLNFEQLKNFIVPHPSKQEQERIVSCLNKENGKIDKIIKKIGKSIDWLHEYRTTLISSAVTGKIDVRNAV